MRLSVGGVSYEFTDKEIENIPLFNHLTQDVHGEINIDDSYFPESNSLKRKRSENDVSDDFSKINLSSEKPRGSFPNYYRFFKTGKTDNIVDVIEIAHFLMDNITERIAGFTFYKGNPAGYFRYIRDVENDNIRYIQVIKEGDSLDDILLKIPKEFWTKELAVRSKEILAMRDEDEIRKLNPSTIRYFIKNSALFNRSLELFLNLMDPQRDEEYYSFW